jgi:hypothetical protein
MHAAIDAGIEVYREELGMPSQTCPPPMKDLYFICDVKN